jgi:hypothetical protein
MPNIPVPTPPAPPPPPTIKYSMAKEVGEPVIANVPLVVKVCTV